MDQECRHSEPIYVATPKRVKALCMSISSYKCPVKAYGVTDYGWAIQEIIWPFENKGRKSSIKTLRPALRLASHPNSEERGGIKSQDRLCGIRFERCKGTVPQTPNMVRVLTDHPYVALAVYLVSLAYIVELVYASRCDPGGFSPYRFTFLSKNSL
jgi:hypothetical protein